jgi:uncharacterized protein YbjT (DUF2867 family)
MTILVTGATGHIGRHVVEQLLAAGADVRALTRNPATAALPPAVEIVAGDLARPDTVAPALDGADRLYLFPVPDTAARVTELARRSGIRRIVVHSCGSAAHGDYHLTVERAAANTNVEWTHLRPYGLMCNTLQWADTIRTESVVRAPHGRFTYPHVHEADIAALAVDALLTDRHVGATYTVSGPDAISQLDQARLIGEAIGREVRFEELDRDQTHHLYRSQGWSTEAIDRELFLLSEFVDKPAPLGTTVADLIGRPPRTFAQWAIQRAGTFR